MTPQNTPQSSRVGLILRSCLLGIVVVAVCYRAGIEYNKQLGSASNVSGAVGSPRKTASSFVSDFLTDEYVGNERNVAGVDGHINDHITARLLSKKMGFSTKAPGATKAPGKGGKGSKKGAGAGNANLTTKKGGANNANLTTKKGGVGGENLTTKKGGVDGAGGTGGEKLKASKTAGGANANNEGGGAKKTKEKKVKTPKVRALEVVSAGTSEGEALNETAFVEFEEDKEDELLSSGEDEDDNEDDDEESSEDDEDDDDEYSSEEDDDEGDDDESSSDEEGAEADDAQKFAEMLRLKMGGEEA